MFQFGTLEILSSMGLQRAEHVKVVLPPKKDNRSHLQERLVVTVVCLPHQDVGGPQKLSNKEIRRKTPSS